MSARETIVALASAPGRAGVAVLRLSGPDVATVIGALCRKGAQPLPLPEARRATLCDLVHPVTNEVLDHALVIFFPAPHSFTGEDVAEFHVHGGRAIVRETLDALCACKGVRPAAAGEFSRRAFENGKMDLTEAEAIADLVDAETTAQRRQALRQMEGALGQLYTGWAERIKHNLAYIEAEIDFADEDIPPDLSAGRRQDIAALCEEIAAHLDDHHRGERLREGFTVALLGAPNAGKSSLLNALARREVAIVSPTPGTTRDVVEVQLDLGGYPVSLADTAGLRETADEVESEGVRRALARAEQADLKLLVIDGAQPLEAAQFSLWDEDCLLLVNKSDCDLPVVCVDDQLAGFLKDKDKNKNFAARVLFVSAKTGQGLQELTQRLTEEIARRYMASAAPALTRARHRLLVQECHDYLTRALRVQETELCAEDLRLAMRSIGQITGHVDIEDILDVIFSSFCIGK